MRIKLGTSTLRARWRGLLGLMSLLWLAAGCAATGGQVGWPDLEIGAQLPPQAEEGEPKFVRGDDGMIYITGAIEAVAGQAVLGHFSGEWPLQEASRPALWAGQVLGQPEQGVFLVHPVYEFPDVKVEELVPVVVDGFDGETMGKGIVQVGEIDFSGPTQLSLSLGTNQGANVGDFYGILTDGEGEVESVDQGQLTRRLRGICMIVETEAQSSLCRLWQGHPDHEWAGRIEAGQRAIFLEPGFGKAPRMGTITVSPTGDEEVDDWARQHLENYFSRFPGARVEVASFGEMVDASDPSFYHWGRRERAEEPTILLALTLQKRGGKDHLVVNYSGVSAAIGPGMVAAPPEGGVDMGPVDSVSDDDWRGLSAVLMGAMMVYRGQNSEGLAHLHEALRDGGLRGKLRWHARDQYAMRWGALDRLEEAIWLVREDEATAMARGDEEAYLNALGTRVRLHDFLEQPELAQESAREYLEAQQPPRAEGGYLSARAMYAEMAVQNQDREAAREAVEELLALCPDGCQGDLFIFLAGIYWAAYDEDESLQIRVVEEMIGVARRDDVSDFASARMFQGWEYLRNQDQTQALIAFLEAERLFASEGIGFGAARAQFYIAATQVARNEPQQAFEKAMEALSYMEAVGDYGSKVRIYERLAQIYMDLGGEVRPGPYLGSGGRVLHEYLQSTLSTGNYGGAAQAAFSFGHFLFRVQQVQEARRYFQRSVIYAIRVAGFDIAAMSHLFLAMVARMEGDIELFEEEIARAQVMAAAADDPAVEELIEELLSPGPVPGEDPTQVL